MEKQENIWKYFDDTYKVYSENEFIIKSLCSEINAIISTSYYINGKEYGWEVVIQEKQLNKARKILKRKF